VHGVLTPAMPEWPGAPCCRRHIVECIEANEPPVMLPPMRMIAPSSAELQ
jgi:hypothetical protein